MNRLATAPLRSASRFAAVMMKELRQLRRDRLTFGMVIGVPLLQLLLFGYAINLDVRNLPTAVADQSNSYYSRQLVRQLGQSQITRISHRATTPQELLTLIRDGSVAVGILIPADYERRLLDQRRGAVQVLLDGSDPTVVAAVGQLATMPLARTSAAVAAEPLFAVQPLYNPEQRTAVNIVPGLLGVILTLTMILFTAVAIVRERERGNLELLINTPVSTLELMIGKVVPYIGIGLIQVLVILVFGQWLFAVPIRGAVLDLYLAAMVFIAANLALGLLISTLARSQFQAMQMTFFIMLPSILLSGFMFPFSTMPAPAQWIGNALPNTHFVNIARGIMLREAGLADLAGEMLALAAITVVAITLAALRFSRRLD